MKKTLEDLQIKPSKKAELCCRAMDLGQVITVMPSA